MSEKFVALRIRVSKALEARQAGQGTLEYVGMVAVAALLAFAVVTVAKGVDLGAFFQDQVNKILGR